jgi:hypothetical protein
VAGGQGLGLSPALLDEEPGNGELHPDGVALVGALAIQVSYLAESGDEDDPAVEITEEISEARLARLAAQIEEATLRNELVDPDDTLDPDAQRDLFLERARFGLTHTPDPRSLARSEYVYRGVRERYGVVRARESLLPFELVLQGSLSDLSLGAFPRIREPRRTPDAVLYR